MLLWLFIFFGPASSCYVTWTGLYANNIREGYEAIPFDELSGEIHEVTFAGKLHIAEGASVLMICQDGKKTRQICLNNKFLVGWRDTACNKPQQSAFVTIHNSPLCFQNEQHISVFIDFPEIRINLYKLCFNEKTMSTREVVYSVYMGATAVFYNIPRPTDRWAIEQYQQFLVPKAYTRKQQLLNIANSFSGGLEYWKQQSLQRGHLATFTAFPFFFERNATCEYVNNSPQWASVNMGNLAKVEYILEQTASQMGHIEIVHINYLQLELPDLEGNEHKIALLPEANLIEVPKYILKYATDPITMTRFVFVVLNNPFLQYTPTPPCPEQTNSIFWRPELFRTHTHKDIQDGYTWLCLAKDMYYSAL